MNVETSSALNPPDTDKSFLNSSKLFNTTMVSSLTDSLPKTAADEATAYVWRVNKNMVRNKADYRGS